MCNINSISGMCDSASVLITYTTLSFISKIHKPVKTFSIEYVLVFLPPLSEIVYCHGSVFLKHYLGLESLGLEYQVQEYSGLKNQV